MKKYILLCCALSIMMIITPLMSVQYVRVKNADESNAADSVSTEDSVIKVMISENGYIESVSVKEYLIGSLAGEMSPTVHTEALKAQTVACYTFAKYISLRDSEKLGGADITDDSSVYQSYVKKEERQKKWGDDFDKNEKLMSAAVDAVLGEYLSYDGAPAMAAYFDTCSGQTESAANVWGKEVPYLVSVKSTGDRLSPDYETKKTVTEEEFESAFEKKGITLSGDADNWVGKPKRFDSGIVKNITVGSKEISGSQFRSILSLKSADFDVSYSSGKFTLTCRGNGHFVGMSQYGADYMARQGSTYRDILAHYYPGTTLLKVNFQPVSDDNNR